MKKVFEIRRESSQAPVQPVLNIRIGYTHFSMAVADQASAALYSLDYYTDEEEIDAGAVREQLDRLQAEGFSFHRVKLVYDYPDASFIPVSVTLPDEAARLRVPPAPGMMLITEKIPSWQLYNVYPVPAPVHTLLSTRFPNLQSLHSLSVGLRNIDPPGENGALCIDITHDTFSIIAARSGTLLLAQHYPYNNPQDLLYYLLSVCHEYGLSQNEVQVLVTGLLDQESALYRELFLYFEQLRFREARWQIPDSAYPPHFFTTLNDLMVCVS